MADLPAMVDMAVDMEDMAVDMDMGIVHTTDMGNTLISLRMQF
jgi:hypothetical protein